MNRSARAVGRQTQRLLCSLILISALLIPASTAAVTDTPETTPPPVLISEIAAYSENGGARLEFIELHNTGARPVDLAGWRLTGGVDFQFRTATEIAAGGYLVVGENQDALRSTYAVESVGPYQGRLSAAGEELSLRTPDAQLVDRVDYSRGFPWPTVGIHKSDSIQIVHPSIDNSLPGAWRAAPPTPGQANNAVTARAALLVEDVLHTPRAPQPGETVTVTVSLEADSPLPRSARLGVQVVAPGRYITRHDPAYETEWEWLPLQRSGDRLWQGSVPARYQQHRTLVRYRIELVDGNGGILRLPYIDDPQPNFAWFVYGALPPYAGPPGADTVDSASPQPLFDFTLLEPLPVYHMIAKDKDVADALFMPPSPLDAGYTGYDYRWLGTLVYDGVVYDHVGFRSRGENYRYASGKNHWKIDFLPGRPFHARDDQGHALAPRDKLILNAVMLRAWTGRRGESGLYESLGFRLFDLAGVPSPRTHFVHWRVITDTHEAMSPYRNDFWGLYLAIEEIDGDFLDARDMPDGNLYKNRGDSVDREHLGIRGPSDSSDIQQLIDTWQTPGLGIAYWQRTLDLAHYYSYRAVVEFMRHYDIPGGRNTVYFADPASGQWSVLPWDLDKSWWSGMGGSGDEPFLHTILGEPAFALAYQNRLRELRDLLFTPEQFERLLTCQVALIHAAPVAELPPPSMVEANRARWDRAPILTTRYVNPSLTWPGAFYSGVPGNSFEGILADLRASVEQRIAYINTALLEEHPGPGVAPLAPDFAVDHLRFVWAPSPNAIGNAAIEAVQWRIAEVEGAGTDGCQPPGRPRMEIIPSWQSAPRSPTEPSYLFPAGAAQPGFTYRVRARLLSADGHWSSWSAPVEFTATPPVQHPSSELRLTEIMYHPQSWNGLPDNDLEFIELMNAGATALDLSGAQITGGIDFTFPLGLRLGPGGRLVMAADAEAFAERYGKRPAGEYRRNLSNSGDRLELRDSWGRSLLTAAYDDAPPWPPQADGDGHSLVFVDNGLSFEDPAAWQPSRFVGGSPGGSDSFLSVWLPLVHTPQP